MNVMDHLVELVDTNVFQNQVNLNDPDSHSCKLLFDLCPKHLSATNVEVAEKFLNGI